MCGRFTLTVDPADLKDAFEDYTFPPKICAALQHRADATGAGNSKRHKK